MKKNRSSKLPTLEIRLKLLGAVLATLLLTVVAIRAQTFTTLKSFGVLTNVTGFNPGSRLTLGPDGTLYGTTPNGEGIVRGTIFKIQPDGSGFTVLKWFTNFFSDGAEPFAELALDGSVLYGTTFSGGSSGFGTIFKINTDGTGYSVLKHLSLNDGYAPNSGLILDGGVLYGTTVTGGNFGFGNGTVFKVNTNGTGFTVLKTFTYNTTGGYLSGRLTLSEGVLYGTAGYGGISNSGTIFRLNTDGTGFAVLKEFTGSDGRYPYSGLTLSGGVLYGTTYSGGASDAGTLFRMDPNGTGFAVIKSFTSDEGGGPSALTLVGSVLYGTTAYGGSSNQGMAFQINTNGMGYTVLKNFNGSDGADPAGVIFSNGLLHGVTSAGGNSDVGTVYAINTDGTGHAVLKHFTRSEDAKPAAVLAVSGSELYGTTTGGGSSGHGTVFKINSDGTGYIVLKDFAGHDGAGDLYSSAGLTFSGSMLYAMTRIGGASNLGTIYRLNKEGTDHAVLRHFSGSDGSYPEGRLVLAGGALYGTTGGGGSSNSGTIFKLNTDGTGFTTFKHFAPAEGAPAAGLALSDGVLYGTTFNGGSADVGTVFKLNIDGTGFTVLKHFTWDDGAYPNAGVIVSGGVLYGTTGSGGISGDGTVFKVNADGTGFAVLKKFKGNDGRSPSAELTLVASTLYGTTEAGGHSDFGTVFKMNSDGTGYRVLKHFTGPDGQEPSAALTFSGQALYGTTYRGGDLGAGTVFRLNFSSVPAPAVRYVNVNNASPTPPYTNWATAAVTIQDAINAALPDDQILVTNGIYSVGATIVSDVGTNRVAITNVISVQSVNGPEFTVIDGGGLVRCAYLMDGSRIAGFTLTNGVADSGGGVMCQSEEAFISNCVLAGNSAAVSDGGGAYAGTLVNCVLTGNSAPLGLGGGAAWSTLNNCILAGNLARDGGGAVSLSLNNCILRSNSAAYGGGAAFSTLYHSLVENNSATDSGGGVESSQLVNCTLSGNSGGAARGSWLFNCISYFNTPDNYDAFSELNYTCTMPLPGGGVGNITDAPLFADHTSGNLRLQSNSPCINAGNNAYVGGSADLDGRPRIQAGTVDMGAYEFQPGVSGEFIGWLAGFGLPTDGSADDADTDADGHNAWQEWIAGTVPTDALSALRLLTPTNDESGFTVTWQSVGNRTYFLERASNHADQPPFSLRTSNIVGQSGTMSYTDTNAAGFGQLFYRVGVQ